MKTIYRAEAIGSLLRPAYLRNARRSLRSREITTAQFKKIEDRAVDEMIALPEAAGLDVVTDGEVRRQKRHELCFSEPSELQIGTL